MSGDNHLSIERIRDDFQGHIESLKERLSETDLEHKIELGSILWDLGDQIKSILDVIKTDVREEALEKLGHQPGSTTLHGYSQGSVTVTVPQASLRVPKGTDIEGIKKALGNRFSLFFEETLTYKPQKEFEDRVVQLDDSFEQKILIGSIERKEMTPRVSFKSGPSGK